MKIRKRLVIPIAAVLIAAIGYLGFAYMKSIASESDGFVYYGTVEAEQLDACAEVSGVIKEIKVQEGQQVSAGSLLAIIDAPENRIKAEQSEISLESAENELARTQEGNREEEINIQKALVQQAKAALSQAEAGLRQSESMVGQAEQSLKSAQDAYKLKKEQYEDIKALYENGAATRQDLDNAEYSMNTALYSMESARHSLDSAGAQRAASIAQVGSARSQLAASEEKLKLLLAGATERSLMASRYSVEQAEKGLELSELTLNKSKVLAAKGGTIESVNYSEGEYVGVGSPVVTIVDLSDLWVKIYVPEKALPGLTLGKSVSISCDHLKGKEIKGQIVYISPEAEFTPINIITKEDRMKLVFAVKVRLTDGPDGIRPGMLLNVSIK